MDMNQIKENKLKTILRFSIPSIIGRRVMYRCWWNGNLWKTAWSKG